MAMPLAGRERSATVEGVQLQTAIEHGADGLQHFVGVAALQEGSGGLSPHGFSSFLLGEMMKTIENPGQKEKNGQFPPSKHGFSAYTQDHAGTMSGPLGLVAICPPATLKRDAIFEGRASNITPKPG